MAAAQSDPLAAVLAEASRLGEAALEAGDQADFGTLIDLAVQTGPSVTSGHSDSDEPVIPSVCADLTLTLTRTRTLTRSASEV